MADLIEESSSPSSSSSSSSTARGLGFGAGAVRAPEEEPGWTPGLDAGFGAGGATTVARRRGATTTLAHVGHDTCWPAYCSSTSKCCPQGQANDRAMIRLVAEELGT